MVPPGFYHPHIVVHKVLPRKCLDPAARFAGSPSAAARSSNQTRTLGGAPQPSRAPLRAVNPLTACSDALTTDSAGSSWDNTDQEVIFKMSELQPHQPSSMTVR